MNGRYKVLGFFFHIFLCQDIIKKTKNVISCLIYLHLSSGSTIVSIKYSLYLFWNYLYLNFPLCNINDLCYSNFFFFFLEDFFTVSQFTCTFDLKKKKTHILSKVKKLLLYRVKQPNLDLFPKAIANINSNRDPHKIM